MDWTVDFHPLFFEEVKGFSGAVKKALEEEMIILRAIGPQLGRPQVDTLKTSQHSNMKELRFDADNGVWRVAFAFDPERKAILLVGGDKAGKNQKRFYKQLIKTADERFSQHLKALKEKKS